MQVDNSPYHEVNKIANNLKSNGISGEYLTSQQLKDKYMLDYPNSFVGLLEKSGGVLLASKCLQAVQVASFTPSITLQHPPLSYCIYIYACLHVSVPQNQFIKFGGVLRDNEKVIEIIPGHIVKVKTNKGTYLSKKVILTPGTVIMGVPRITLERIIIYYSVVQCSAVWCAVLCSAVLWCGVLCCVVPCCTYHL